ncbi:hypothetical protein BKI52_19340 [marine bacterium AO1-C]|nr:hypothetical protein BKI52_19340 [marine bacterium AO1-C]
MREFIKYVHLSNYLPIKEKKRISTSIFQEALKGFELDDDAIRRIKVDIKRTFQLLPIHEKQVIQSLEDAVRSMG